MIHWGIHSQAGYKIPFCKQATTDMSGSVDVITCPLCLAAKNSAVAKQMRGHARRRLQIRITKRNKL